MKTFSLLEIIFLVSIFTLSITSINDSDAFTHLSLGREIINNYGFPLTEPFNHTSLDKAFGYPEWFFGVIFYAIYAILGAAGVVIFKAGIITLTYFVLFKDSVQRSEGQKWLDAIAVVILFFIAIMVRERFVERPEILSNLFLVFTIFSLNQFFYHGKKYIYFIPIIFIIWANAHPSIIIGLYPFIAFIIGGFVQMFFNKSESEQKRRLAIIALILFISIPCILINPYTYNILVAPRGLASNIWRYEVTELVPANWQGYKSLYIFIGIIFLSFLFNLKQSIVYILLVLPFVALSTSAIRFIALIGIVGGPIIVRNISNLKFQTQNLKVTLVQILISISIITLSVITIANIGPFKSYIKIFGLSIDASSLPDGALEYLDKNNIQGRMFNTFHYGGYITFKGHPKRLTFIDGRGGAAMPDYLNARADQKSWEGIEKKYGIDIAILEYPQVPSSLLDMDKDFCLPFKGWTLVYWDEASLVYLKNDAFKDIIERDGYKYIKPANGPRQFSQRLYNREYKEGVVRELERNIKTNPNPIAYLLLGFVYNEMGEFDRAMEFLNRVFNYTRMGHLFPLAHSGLGFSYTNKNDLKAALYHFKKSLDYTEDTDVMYNLGIIYSKMQDDKNAIYYFKKAISLRTNLLSAYINLMEIYKKLRYEDELNEIKMEYSKKLEAMQTEEHFKRGVRLYFDGKSDEAFLEFSKSLELNPYSPSTHTNIGFIYYDRGNLEMAKREFNIAIEVDKDWTDAHYGLALVYKKSGDRVNAKKEFEEYLRINPRGFWARKAREEISQL